MRGSELDLVVDCEANRVDCQNFTSSPEKATQYFNRTFTLPEMSYCDIEINAELELARVVFDNTSFLGV